MRPSSILCLVFLYSAIWIFQVSSQPDDDDDDANDDGPADIVDVENEMTALETELRLGKRKFHELWRNLKSRVQEEEAVVNNDPTIQTLKLQTRKIRRSLTRGLRSLNDFMTCLNSCHKAHTDNDDHTASEANIRYFCNHSCLMVFESTDSSSFSSSGSANYNAINDHYRTSTDQSILAG